MLKLVGIEQIRPGTYLTSFDRDGRILQYEFMTIRVFEEDAVGVCYPEQATMDLIDYLGEDKPGEGALAVEPVMQAAKLVRKFARGEKVELPVVLDER